MQDNSRWHTFDNIDQAAEAVCQCVLVAANQAIVERGLFKLVLAGGRTPEKIYQLLAYAQADWKNWFIYYSDERCLPKKNKDRNSQMAAHMFLEHVGIPDSHIFSIPAEMGAERGAKAYQPIVDNAVPFDMVLLGMGEDGHTASLFPNQSHSIDESVHAVFNAPKPPAERISLSAGVLSNTLKLIFFIIGLEKRKAMLQWQLGEPLPVSLIKPDVGIDIYTDSTLL